MHNVHFDIRCYGPDWGEARQGSLATTKQGNTKQDKARQGNTGGLGTLLIHQLMLVCWSVVPQTISFYNPEPSYTRSSLMAYAERCRDEAALSRRGCIVALPKRGCTAKMSRRGYTIRMPKRGCATETPRHGNIAETNLSNFCVVGSRP